jgi:hypothetical protein
MLTKWLAGAVIPMFAAACMATRSVTTRPTPLLEPTSELLTLNTAERMRPRPRMTRWHYAILGEMLGLPQGLKLERLARIAARMCAAQGLRLTEVIDSYARRNRLIRL